MVFGDGSAVAVAAAVAIARSCFIGISFSLSWSKGDAAGIKAERFDLCVTRPKHALVLETLQCTIHSQARRVSCVLRRGIL